MALSASKIRILLTALIGSVTLVSITAGAVQSPAVEAAATWDFVGRAEHFTGDYKVSGVYGRIGLSNPYVAGSESRIFISMVVGDCTPGSATSYIELGYHKLANWTRPKWYSMCRGCGLTGTRKAGAYGPVDLSQSGRYAQIVYDRDFSGNTYTIDWFLGGPLPTDTFTHLRREVGVSLCGGADYAEAAGFASDNDNVVGLATLSYLKTHVALWQSCGSLGTPPCVTNWTPSDTRPHISYDNSKYYTYYGESGSGANTNHFLQVFSACHVTNNCPSP